MLPNVFIWFLDQENIGLDPKIMILHEVISEILEISDFAAAILKNDLNKMVPLSEDHGGEGGGGEGGGGAWGPPLTHGLNGNAKGTQLTTPTKSWAVVLLCSMPMGDLPQVWDRSYINLSKYLSI